MIQELLERQGYVTLPNFYSAEELAALRLLADQVGANGAKYAIRSLLKTASAFVPVVLNGKLGALLKQLQPGAVCTKSIYFDKPLGANWGVYWHQDRTINVAQKHDSLGFMNWTRKQNIASVQPPVPMLHNTITVRVHLDDTAPLNGALRVVPRSHKNGFLTDAEISELLKTNDPLDCTVHAGGAMLMKPLLVHSSHHNQLGAPRRVLHLEFANQPLPAPLQWAEYLPLPT